MAHDYKTFIDDKSYITLSKDNAEKKIKISIKTEKEDKSIIMFSFYIDEDQSNKIITALVELRAQLL